MCNSAFRGGISAAPVLQKFAEVTKVERLSAYYLAETFSACKNFFDGYEAFTIYQPVRISSKAPRDWSTSSFWDRGQSREGGFNQVGRVIRFAWEVKDPSQISGILVVTRKRSKHIENLFVVLLKIPSRWNLVERIYPHELEPVAKCPGGTSLQPFRNSLG